MVGELARGRFLLPAGCRWKLGGGGGHQVRGGTLVQGRLLSVGYSYSNFIGQELWAHVGLKHKENLNQYKYKHNINIVNYVYPLDLTYKYN